MAVIERSMAGTRWLDLSDPAIILVHMFDTQLSEVASLGALSDAPGDPPGLTSLWARLHSTDAALDEKRIQEMAYSVCTRDPRSAAERRADALSALIAGTSLACQCGAADCEAGRGAPPAKNTVIYVIAEATETSDQDTTGGGDCDDPDGLGNASPAPGSAAKFSQAGRWTR